jgi:glycoprotein 6-alpha-L-fucosyltransferase
MEIVEEYIDILICQGHERVNRKVFLATDDPQVVTEVGDKYPNYEIIADTDSATQGGHPIDSHSKNGHLAIAKDTLQLASSDFLVCTFSSNICRLAYCLRTATKPLVTDLYEVVSLDSDYYILQESEKMYKANLDRKRFQSNELNLDKNDTIVTKSYRTWNRVPPYIGYKKSKANEKKHFLRSAMTRIYPNIQ